MAEASRDNNRITTILGVSNADETTPVPIQADPTTGRLLVNSNLSSISGTTVSEYAEDDPHTSGDKGVMALAVRQDSQVDFGADGDYVPLSVDANGALRIALSSIEGTTVSEYAEDDIHTSGDKGVMSLAVRNDTLAALAGTDGDYAPLQVNANGALFAEISSALPAGSNEIGVVIANLGATDNAVLDSIDAGISLIDEQSTNIAGIVNYQDEIATSLATLDNTVSGNELQVDVVNTPTVNTELPAAVALADSTANPTAPAVGSFPLVWGGTTWDRVKASTGDGSSATGMQNVLPMLYNGSNHDRFRGNTTTGLFVGGAIAHDSAVSGNPLQLAGEARSSDRTSVANADVSRLITDLGGKLVTSPYAVPELFLSGRTSTTAAGGSNVLIEAQGAGTRIYVTSLIISNASATDTEVVITEDGGTELATFPAPQAGGAVHAFPTPFKLPDVNTDLTYELVGAATTVTVTAVGYVGV